MPKSVFTEKYEHFRLLLVQARKQVGISQAQLSERLSRLQSFVSKYERGERRLDVVEFEQVAVALGIEPLHRVVEKGRKR